MGLLIFGLFVLGLLLGGGLFLFRKGYEASRENYIKSRKWRLKKMPRWERAELRPRKSATGLSRKPPREDQGRRPRARYRGGLP
jgi:hypothetical protein